MSDFIRNHPIICYVLLACALSWPTGYIGLSDLETVPETIRVTLNYFAKFGPSLAGIIMTYLLLGREGTMQLLRGLLNFTARPKWYFIALILPSLAWLSVIGFLVMQGNSVGPFEAAGLLIVPVLIAKHFFIGGGLGEELGWRGFMLPRLQDKHSALGSSIILGVVWGLWHLPALIDEGAVSIVLFTIYTTVLAIIYTWVFNGTGGNLFIVTLLHATMNGTNGFMEKLFPGLTEIDSRVILVGLCWLIFAVGLIIVTGPRKLTRGEKKTSGESVGKADLKVS